MKYTLRHGVMTNIKKLQNKFINLSVASMFALTSLSGAAPLFLTGSASAITPSTVEIYNSADLSNAINSQLDGQTWNIHSGDYALTADNNTVSAGGQTGWYLPIVADNITINGVGGRPTIYGGGYTANGAWHTQDLVAIFGDNVKLNNLTFMPKVEPNKTIEVMGNNTTLSNLRISPNNKVPASVYDNIANDTDKAFAKQWGGSIYYNTTAGGVQTLKNVIVSNGGISDHSATATVNITNVKLNYMTGDDFTNSYRLYVASPSAVINGSPLVTYTVKSSLDNLVDALANIQNGDIIRLGSNLTTTQQITLTKSITFNGAGHTISPHFTKTTNDNNSAVGIQADHTTVDNLTVNGANGTNLHGINVWQADDVQLNDVSLKNNDHSGLNVDGSNVTVNNLTTAGNGWDGVDVDKAGAILTVNGVSHHDENGPDLYIDNTAIGQVIDTNHQYGTRDFVMIPTDRAYGLKLPAPVLTYPANNGYTTTNDFWFNWEDVTGAASYEFQASQSNSIDGDGSLNHNVWSGDYQHHQPTDSTLHSVGASGSWYWQVRAVDSLGIAGAWSPFWKMTVDTTKPDVHLVSPADGTVTNGSSVTQSWATSSSDVDHYEYQSYNDAGLTSLRYSATYNTTSKTATDVTDTSYWWRVRAVDNAGNKSDWTPAWKLTVDNIAPVVNITAPSNGDTVHGTVTISGTVTDANPDHYYLVVKNSHGNVVAGPGVVNQANVADWNWDTTGVVDGTYTIDLEARDKAGNKDAASSQTITVIVDNTAPTATIDAYTGTDTTPTLTGTVDDPTADLTITVDGGTPANATNNGDGTWTYTLPTALSVGTHSIVLTATDTADNSYTTSANATVQAPPASPQGLAHSSGSGNSNQAPGHQPTVTVTPNNDGQVLGATTDRTSADDTGKVKGDSINLTTNKSDDKAASTSNAFLGLGWWWIVVAAVAVLFFGLIFRKSGTNQTNA